MATEFITDRYEFAHGRRPKGTGSWAFEASNGALFWAQYGTYTEAKREAREWARENGYGTLWVCS